MPAHDDQSLLRLAAALGKELRAAQHRVATVESCTGGGIARLLTEIPGCSRWFERGFVTYSDAAKVEMVGVPRELLQQHGAVSVEVAAAMAEGGMRCSGADYAIAVTGIAGPDGGTEEKPVGRVCFAWTDGRRKTRWEQVQFSGDRHGIRQQSIAHALTELLEWVEG